MSLPDGPEIVAWQVTFMSRRDGAPCAAFTVDTEQAAKELMAEPLAKHFYRRRRPIYAVASSREALALQLEAHAYESSSPLRVEAVRQVLTEADEPLHELEIRERAQERLGQLTDGLTDSFGHGNQIIGILGQHAQQRGQCAWGRNANVVGPGWVGKEAADPDYETLEVHD